MTREEIKQKTSLYFLLNPNISEEEKTMFNQWIEMNGGEDGSLYMTFSDEELEQIFLTAVEVYEKNRR